MDHLRKSRRQVVGAVALAFVVVAVVAILTIGPASHRGPASPTPATPSPTAPATTTSGFRGIFQFTGTPHPENPAVVGGVALFNWSDLEPADGTFRWEPVDAAVATWSVHGKQVAIRVQTVVPTTKAPPATPAWLFAEGVPSINDGRTMVPQYWNGLYLAKLQEFARAFGQRYDGNPSVAWVQGGVGVYSETKVDSTSIQGIRQVWDAAGYSDALWFDTVKRIVSIWKAPFPRTPLAISVDSSFIDRSRGYSEDTVVDWLVGHGIWPQNDGLRRDSKVKNPNWRRGPNLQEQYNATAVTGDVLSDDLDRALDYQATYALIYGSDLEEPANQATLDRVATMASSRQSRK